MVHAMACEQPLLVNNSVALASVHIALVRSWLEMRAGHCSGSICAAPCGLQCRLWLDMPFERRFAAGLCTAEREAACGTKVSQVHAAARLGFLDDDA